MYIYIYIQIYTHILTCDIGAVYLKSLKALLAISVPAPPQVVTVLLQ